MRLLVLGGGESGTGAALLAAQKGWEVKLSEYGTLKQTYKDALLNKGIAFEEGGHSEAWVNWASLIVKSPGIAEKTPIMQQVLAAKIPWEDEIEFASRYSKGKVVAITGSNGKTTTTMLTYHLLLKAGLNVGLAGNIGKSWAMQLCEGDKDYWVLELSSFQLDGLRNCPIHIAMLCNISPDHLDRYGYELSNYAKAKWRVTSGQTAQDYFIWNADDEISEGLMKTEGTKAQCLPFSLKEKQALGAYLENEEIQITTNHKDELKMTIHELALQGKHNVANSMAAAIASRVLEIRKESVRESLADFKGAPHRLEFVATVHGIDFINDSKATNVNSTWWALESANKPVIWIVGGVDKGNDYSSLKELVNDKVKAIVCLGLDNAKIKASFEGLVPAIVETNNMKHALELSYQLGAKGDAVLLSPCCASFDLFENYEDRGNQFKKEVRAL